MASPEHDPTDLRGQERDRDEKEKKDRLRRREEADDLKWLMSSKRGRRIVWRMLEASGVYRLSFAPNAMQMAFAEGNRNYGLRMLAQVHEHCPELYPAMLKENHEDEQGDADGG